MSFFSKRIIIPKKSYNYWQNEKRSFFSFKIRPQGYYFFRSKNYPIFKIPTDKVNVTKFEWKSQIKPWEKARSLTSTTTIEKGQYYRELSVRQTHRVVLEPAFETSLESFILIPKKCQFVVIQNYLGLVHKLSKLLKFALCSTLILFFWQFFTPTFFSNNKQKKSSYISFFI